MDLQLEEATVSELCHLEVADQKHCALSDMPDVARAPPRHEAARTGHAARPRAADLKA